MIDVLNKYLSTEPKGCVTAQWISTLSEEEQAAFALVKEKNTQIKIANLYIELSTESELPFKLTAFRSHLRGYCTCR